MPSRKASPKRSSARTQDSFTAAEKAYTAAMKHFVEKKDWAKSAEAFEAFAETYGADTGLAELVDRARTHLATCQTKISPPSVTPETGDDWLLEGVVLSNEGRIEDSLAAFEKALADGAEEAKVYYARAAAMARAERSDEAVEDLRRAIEANPDNRAFALGDADFERVRELATFVSLVEPPAEGDTADEGGFDEPESSPTFL